PYKIVRQLKETSIVTNSSPLYTSCRNYRTTERKAMLDVKQLGKVYEGKVPYRALTDIDIHLEKGEFIRVMGPSGSGKTTLLNIIATIDEPTTGEVLIEGDNPHQLKKNQLAKFRRQELGCVF